MVGKIQKKTLLSNQKGQAIFELIIFLPFLIFLYSIYYTTGNSISASINQQKAVRGYFYSLVRGNSYVNSLSDLTELSDQYSMKLIGFSAIGWREKSGSGAKEAYAPCFKFSSLLKNDVDEECDGTEREEAGRKSRYIRVFTFYGVCGPVYSETSDDTGKFFEIVATAQSNPYNCALDTSPI